MSATAKSITTAERIERAKTELANGCPDYAMASALIAIAELLQTNIAETYVDGVKVGAVATAEALGTILGAVVPGQGQA